MGNSADKEPKVPEINDEFLQRMQLPLEAQQREANRIEDDKPMVHMMEQRDKLSVFDSVSADGSVSEFSNKPTTAQLEARNSTKAKLPTFSGNPEEWHYFRASYEQSTDACGFNDSENLVRLLDSLQGPALKSVRGLLVLPKLVPKAIDTLHQIYGNPEVLLEWYVEKVKKMENLNPHNLMTYVEFTNALEQLCYLIEASGLNHRMTDSSLLYELVRKLPNFQILEWNVQARQIKPITVRAFSDFVSVKLTIARLENPSGNRSVIMKALPAGLKTDRPSSSKPDAFKNEKPSSSNTATGEQGQKDNRTRCRLCKRFGHPLWYCHEFKSLKVEARSALVDSWNLCTICLRDHLIEGKERCPYRIRCNVDNCRERHNPLLHPAKAEGESDDNSIKKLDSFENVVYYDDEGTLRFVNQCSE